MLDYKKGTNKRSKTASSLRQQKNLFKRRDKI